MKYIESVIQIYANHQWHDAAILSANDNHRYRVDYTPEYIHGEIALPLSVAYPVQYQTTTPRNEVFLRAKQVPAFLYDLVPQGNGRHYLLKKLNQADGESMDIPLAQLGAFNTVGKLRLNTAVDFFEQWKASQAVNAFKDGFTFDDIISHQEDFVDYIWQHAMLTAGTTGVQGAAPKFLLTQNRNDRWYAENDIVDAEAYRHWIIKLPRGKRQADHDILTLEATYHALAKEIGLNVQGECFLAEDKLFIERFDRKVTNHGLKRIHQESLLSAAGIAGFGATVSLFTLAETIAKYSSNPSEDVAEFIRRELMNDALGNVDNHGRNSALQRCDDTGEVRLSPLFDFAPMFLDPEVIPKACRWVKHGQAYQKIDAVIDALAIDESVKQLVADQLTGFQEVLQTLPDRLKTLAVDDRIKKLLLPKIVSATQKMVASTTTGFKRG